MSVEVRRVAEMSRQPVVRTALERERDSDDAEGRMLREIFDLEARLGEEGGREPAIRMLRDRLTRLSRRAAGEADTPDRTRARRVLRSITAGARRAACRIGST